MISFFLKSFLTYFSYLVCFITFTFFSLYKLCYFLIQNVGFYNFIYVVFSISFINIAYIISSDLFGYYKSFWIGLIILTNIFGCTLYIFFGKANTNHKKKTLFYSLLEVFRNFNYQNISNIKNNNLISNYILEKTGFKLCQAKIKYLFKNEEILQTILSEVKKAKKFIFLNFFLIEDSTFLNLLIDVLHKKVQNGVEVRLIYDGLGCLNRVIPWFDKKLNKLGIKTMVFKKMHWFNFYDLNGRDHKKMIIIDGKIGFSGSFNICPLNDNCFILEGEIVYNATVLFLSQWLLLDNKSLDELNSKLENYHVFFPKINNLPYINNNNYVQLYVDVPYNYNYANVTFNVYLKLINYAKKYIYIVSPYFFIEDRLEQALIDALKRGVNLKIIVPEFSDCGVLDKISYEIFNKLIINGAEIFYHSKQKNKHFLHAKFCIVDDIMAVTGTFNLNFRSFFYDFENSFFMVKNACISDIKKHFLLLLNESKAYTMKKNFFIMNFFLKKAKIFT